MIRAHRHDEQTKHLRDVRQGKVYGAECVHIETQGKHETNNGKRNQDDIKHAERRETIGIVQGIQSAAVTHFGAHPPFLVDIIDILVIASYLFTVHICILPQIPMRCKQKPKCACSFCVKCKMR